MLNFNPLASSSAGNCYVVSDGITKILLEAGIPIKKIKNGCDYDLSSVTAALITHEHKDHALSVNDVIKAGVDVYMTEGTAAKSGALTYRLKLWRRDGIDTISNPCYHAERIGTFSVKPFMVHHDAAEPVGYLIETSTTGEKLLFVTDTYYIDYTFSRLTIAAVEANYSADALADHENDHRRNRLIKSHMSIENCIEMLKANDLSLVREIWLIHLSTSNGDAEGFKRQVQEATGCEVHIA